MAGTQTLRTSDARDFWRKYPANRLKTIPQRIAADPQCTPNRTHDPRVAVIVVVERGTDHALQCMEALRRDDYCCKDILVVDVGANHDLLATLQAQFSEAAVFQLERAFGFSGGCNVGICHALMRSAKYVLFLNPETIIAPAVISTLVQTAEADPSCGLLAYDVNADDQTSDALLTSPRLDVTITHHITSALRDQPGASVPAPWIPHRPMLIPINVIMEIGGFDDRYDRIWGDMDLSLRINAAGYSVKPVYGAGFGCQNVGSISASEGLISHYYSIVRDGLLFLRTHGGRTYRRRALALVSFYFQRSLWKESHMRFRCVCSVFGAVIDHLLQRYGPHPSRIAS